MSVICSVLDVHVLLCIFFFFFFPFFFKFQEGLMVKKKYRQTKPIFLEMGHF